AGGFEMVGDLVDFAFGHRASGRQRDRSVEQAERESRRDQQGGVGDLLDAGTSFRRSCRIHVDESGEFDPVGLPREIELVGRIHGRSYKKLYGSTSTLTRTFGLQSISASQPRMTSWTSRLRR